MIPGGERLKLFRGVSELERLFEKAMRELVEGCAARPERQSAFLPGIALVLAAVCTFNSTEMLTMADVTRSTSGAMLGNAMLISF